jgi:hypothetical protein
MTKTYATVFTPAEVELLQGCINLGVAQLSQMLARSGVAAVDEATAKLQALKELSAKIVASEREAAEEVAA